MIMDQPRALGNRHPFLKNVSEEVTEFDDSLKEIFEVMVGVMSTSQMAAISAIHVGMPKRAMIFAFNNQESGVQDHLFPMVNPVIIQRSTEDGFNEWYSYPGIYGDRENYARYIVVEYQTGSGDKRKSYFADVNAVLIQQQIQYMDGLVEEEDT